MIWIVCEIIIKEPKTIQHVATILFLYFFCFTRPKMIKLNPITMDTIDRMIKNGALNDELKKILSNCILHSPPRYQVKIFNDSPLAPSLRLSALQIKSHPLFQYYEYLGTQFPLQQLQALLEVE